MSEKMFNLMSEEISDGLKKFLNKETVEDKFDIYVGKVVDNNDPLKLGRCRVRVFGVFDNSISNDDLPWAMPNNTFVGSKTGSFIIPPKDAIVNVYFDDWDVNLPHYTTKVIDQNNLPKNYAKNYPDNMVFFETDNGTSFEIDRSNEDVTFTHADGTVVKIDGNLGDVTFKHKSGTKITVDGVTGDLTFDGNLNTTIKHKGILTVEGSTVTPTGSGPLCAIPSCLYTGAPHTGTQCLP